MECHFLAQIQSQSTPASLHPSVELSNKDVCSRIPRFGNVGSFLVGRQSPSIPPSSQWAPLQAHVIYQLQSAYSWLTLQRVEACGGEGNIAPKTRGIRPAVRV